MNIYKSYILPLCISFVFITISSCKHDHSDHDHAHDEDTHHQDDMHSEDGLKEVHLSQAQFENITIDTGWFSLKNLNEVVNANGYTKLDPRDEADVSMPISGTLKTINVIEGNAVKKGQTLATMSSLEFNRMLREEAAIKKEISIAEEELPFLRAEFDRQKKLSNDNINAKKILEKVSADLKKTEAEISASKGELKLIQDGLTLVGGKGGTSIPIKAPISGFVTHVDAKIGTVVKPGIPIFSIVDNSKMHVDLLIYEKDLGKIKVGQTVRFILTNQSNQEIRGEIYNIGKSFANDTKSVAVHADIEENDANLIPGMYINALIDIGENVVKTLPESAIALAEGKTYIFILRPRKEDEGHEDGEKEFTRIEVATGASQLGFIEVTPLSQIEPGSKIVTDGAYYLQSHLQKSDGDGGHSH